MYLYKSSSMINEGNDRLLPLPLDGFLICLGNSLLWSPDWSKHKENNTGYFVSIIWTVLSNICINTVHVT